MNLKEVYFKFKRVIKTVIIDLIPLEYVNDHSLDSYCIEIYNKNKEVIAIEWFDYKKFKYSNILRNNLILKQKSLAYYGN